MADPNSTDPGFNVDYQKKVDQEFEEDFAQDLYSLQFKFADGSLVSHFIQPLPLQLADMHHPTPLTTTILWQGWRPDLHPARVKDFSRCHSLSTPDTREGLFGQGGVLARTPEKGRLLTVLGAQEGRDKRLAVLYALDVSLGHRLGDPKAFLNRVDLAKQGEQSAPKPLKDLVKGISLLLAAGVCYSVRGDDGSALWAWGLALTKLCPWSSDRSWMTFAEARETGLPRLEHDLLWNIGSTALRMANTSEIKKLGECLASCSKLSWQAAYALPFSTYGEELATFGLAIQLFQQQPGAFRLDFVPNLVDTWSKSIYEWEKKDPEAWPHESCREGHVRGKCPQFF